MASLLTSRKLFLLLFLFTLIVLSISLSISRNVQAAGAAVVSGELKTWHKITLTWDGPNTSETANPNPFLDYRLDVTFSSGASTYTIPGYYCADGNAAETSATSGSKWCAHFAPDSSGTWNYTAAFTSGSKVAINGGGSSAGFFDGDSGSFSVDASDKSGNDFRGKGRAAYVGEHYLQHLGSGEYLIKCGADAPERAFDYEDFDATNGYFDWQEHQQDFSAAASPYTWQNGKGSELLGAIKYIQSTGCNAFSFLTFSLSGDSDSIAPHLDDSDGTPSFWNDVHPDRFDISKMSQWERIMQYADQEGVFLHFKTFEQENDHLMDWEERRLYYRMLIAAYSHHMALNWNLAEEISMGNNPDGTSEQTLIRSTLQYIADIDPYDHLRVFHTFGVDKNTKYGWFLGESYQGQALLSGTSLQTGIGSVAGDVRTWVEDSGSAGLKWVVANDEQNGAQTGVDSDDVAASRKLVREFVTWGTLMNGGAGTEFYYGYQTTFNGQSCSDLTCDNHRSRESKYLDAGIASQFFRDHLPYWQMAPMHSLSDNSNDWVYGKAGEVYALYLRDGGSTNITVSDSGPWRLDWFNPRTGVFERERYFFRQCGNQQSAGDRQTTMW